MSGAFRPVSRGEYLRDIREQQIEQERQRLLESGQKAVDSSVSEDHIQNIWESKVDSLRRKKAIGEYKASVKGALLAEAIDVIFEKSMQESGVDTSTSAAKTSRMKYVEAFIKENGAATLLSRFKQKTALLSEISSIVSRNYETILEKMDDNDETTLSISSEDKDKFFDELEDAAIDAIADVVRLRVASAVNDFLSANSADKADIEDAVRSSQKEIDNTEDDAVKEAALTKLKAETFKIRNLRKEKNVFEMMVLAISEAAIKDPIMKEQFTTSDNRLNLDSIMESVTTMYTFLEVLNTTKMESVDESFIKRVITDLRA